MTQKELISLLEEKVGIIKTAVYSNRNDEIIEDRTFAIEKAFSNMKSGYVLCLLAKGEDRYQQIKGKILNYDLMLEFQKD